jgi:low affinity Fe/Cu permease
MHESFRRLAARVATAVGSPWTFLASILLIVGWAFSRPLFATADTWQLVINTGTTIVTFLMVFLIQNTQNRDAKGIHLKLDELIKATRGARNSMIDLDSLSDEQLRAMEAEYKRICTSSKDGSRIGPRHVVAAAGIAAVRGELAERHEERRPEERRPGDAG